MLKLKNVKKENRHISAKYYPEDWDEYGLVSVSVDNLDDYQVLLSPTDEKKYKNYPYAIHALNALRSMACGERELKDCLIMWY